MCVLQRRISERHDFLNKQARNQDRSSLSADERLRYDICHPRKTGTMPAEAETRYPCRVSVRVKRGALERGVVNTACLWQGVCMSISPPLTLGYLALRGLGGNGGGLALLVVSCKALKSEIRSPFDVSWNNCQIGPSVRPWRDGGGRGSRVCPFSDISLTSVMSRFWIPWSLLPCRICGLEVYRDARNEANGLSISGLGAGDTQLMMSRKRI